MKLVYLEWEDACGSTGTESLKDCVERNDFMVHTCGVLVAKTKHHISISQDFFPEPGRTHPYRCTEHIPRNYIKRMVILDMPKGHEQAN